MRLRFPDRLAFWNRPPALDLSCISPEDWERLERASRGDERELTARIMLLAYLAKANGHSTFDAVLPDDLTPEEANRLADRLTIGNGQRNGAPGRRTRIRLVQAPVETRPAARRIARPAIFRLLEAVAVVLVGLALIALPFGLTAAPHLILLTITLAACAALTRRVAPGFSISYLLAAAAAAEGSLRTILPVDVHLGSGALIAMALWTRLLQPRFEAGARLRGLAWTGIAASALTVIAAISLQVQTLPIWGPLVVGALACSVFRGPALGRLAGPRVRFRLLAAISAALILPLALPLPYGNGVLQFRLPEVLLGVPPEVLLALASVATAATLVWRRRHLLPALPRLDAIRTRVADAGSLVATATKALPVLIVAFGVVYAMCLVPLAPERIVSNFDMYWLTAAFSVASLLLLRREPLVAMLFAWAAASYAESVLTSAINGWPELHLPFAVALGLWLLVGKQPSRIPAVRFLLRSAAIVTGLAWLATLSGLAVPSSVWILSLTLASMLGIHRAFEHGLMADPRLALAAAAFLPSCAELLLWTFGFPLPDYGTTYISFSNLWLSVAPIGCVLHSLISTAATNHARIEHGST